MLRFAKWCVLIGVTLPAITACATRRPSSAGTPPVASSAKAEPKAPGAGSGVVAVVGGQPVRMSDLQPLLVEAAGAQVLSDQVIDLRLKAELAGQNITVSEEETQREKQRMLERLSEDRDQAVRLLELQRQRRGLGPQRFARLLWRNAALRKLVAGQVQVNEALVRQAYEQRFAEQSECRLILVETLNDVSRVKGRLNAGESFEKLAREVSRDSSRIQGGLIPPVSPADAGYPAAVREVAVRLKAGEISDPIVLDQGFAILRCERKITPQRVPFEQISTELEARVRSDLEQVLIQRRLRVLLSEADVTVLDAQLDEDYKRARSETVIQP